MKLTTIMRIIAVAAATGFCMSVGAGEGKDDNLILNSYVEQFKVTTANPTPSPGVWSNNAHPEIANSKFVIDCDAATSNEFIYSSSTTDQMVKCEFNLAVAPVPVPLAAQRDITQAAFCISTNAAEGGKSEFCAYVNGRWETLAGVDVPAIMSFYDLRMTFDYKNGRFVKFSVKTGGNDYDDLYSATNSALKWFFTGFGEETKGVSRYCFIGTGDVTSFSTAQASIAAETVNVKDAGNVTVPEDVVAVIDIASGKTLADVLAEQDEGGNTVLDNIVLGLRTSEGLKDDGNLITSSADAGSADATKIKLGLNATPPEITGAEVSYQLYGSDTGVFGEEAVAVGFPTSNPAELAIPLNGTIYKYYKVKATITYAE